MEQEQSTAIALMLKVPETNFGPAMRILNDRQKAFVLALLLSGDNNYTRACRMAGYSEKVAHAYGSRLAHDERIQAAIREEGQKRITAASIMAISKLHEIAADNFHKDQLAAIKMLLNRSGFHEKTEHKLTVENTDNKEVVAQIKALAKELGIDAEKVLGVAGVDKVIDAEFTTIERPGPLPGGRHVLGRSDKGLPFSGKRYADIKHEEQAKARLKEKVVSFDGLEEVL